MRLCLTIADWPSGSAYYSLLWGSTVGYPSDSLVSCLRCGASHNPTNPDWYSEWPRDVQLSGQWLQRVWPSGLFTAYYTTPRNRQTLMTMALTDCTSANCYTALTQLAINEQFPSVIDTFWQHPTMHHVTVHGWSNGLIYGRPIRAHCHATKHQRRKTYCVVFTTRYRVLWGLHNHAGGTVKIYGCVGRRLMSGDREQYFELNTLTVDAAGMTYPPVTWPCRLLSKCRRR